MTRNFLTDLLLVGMSFDFSTHRNSNTRTCSISSIKMIRSFPYKRRHHVSNDFHHHLFDFCTQLIGYMSSPIVAFKWTECDIPHIDPEILSEYQIYFNNISVSFSTSDLANWHPGAVSHFLLLTIVNGFPRVYCEFYWKPHSIIASTLSHKLWQYTYLCN